MNIYYVLINTQTHATPCEFGFTNNVQDNILTRIGDDILIEDLPLSVRKMMISLIRPDGGYRETMDGIGYIGYKEGGGYRTSAVVKPWLN